MSTTLNAVAPDARAVIEQELERLNPGLLHAIGGTDEPSREQREAIEQLLADSLMQTFDACELPNSRSLQIESAINAFLEAWPIRRSWPIRR